MDIMAKSKKTKHTSIIPASAGFPPILPIIPIDMRPLFPKMLAPVIIDDEDLKKVITDMQGTDSKYIGLAMTLPDNDKVSNVSNSKFKKNIPNIYNIGVVAEIVQTNYDEETGVFQAMLGVLDRFEIVEYKQKYPYIITQVEYLPEVETGNDEEMKAYSVSIINCIKELVQLNPLFKEELNLFMSRSNLNEPGRLADFAASMTTANGTDLQDILEALDVRYRIEKALVLLKKEIDISKLQVKINSQIEAKMSKQQREFFLREQLKEIKKELGLAKEGKDAEIEKFQKRLEKLTIPKDVKAVIDEEIEKIGFLDQTSPEFNISRNYLDWLTILPWGVFSDDDYDLKKAKRILNQDHYGLEDVKERILEFLAVGKLNKSVKGSIICFVGPPGVGKTSIGQSIARSIGRKFFRFSVGGMRDEAEIKGHRRTYIGALPGKFLQAMKTCKTSNPVIMLDEIDKIGSSFHGDPASALLETLDPEQNSGFLDHFLDVPFDLSNVLFICTANSLETIPSALLDRMEIIRLSGYILEEKLQIAKRYLVPKQIQECGLAKKKVTISNDALKSIISGYAREPGVRGLDNFLKKIMRKSAKHVLTENKRTVKIEDKNIEELLGQAYFNDDDLYNTPRIGVIRGLAWTSMGGDTLFIEATGIKSKQGSFKQTGQLGNVMIESSEIAYTYIRGFLSEDEKATNFFEETSIHLHVPEGATPKDGPSAGVAMSCALYSLAKGVAIKSNFAMTGELSLTGLVLPIGGLKEKTIAAKRVKAVNLLFPKENKKDFDELPKHIKRGLKPHFVSTFDEVVKIVFPKNKTKK